MVNYIELFEAYEAAKKERDEAVRLCDQFSLYLNSTPNDRGTMYPKLLQATRDILLKAQQRGGKV